VGQGTSRPSPPRRPLFDPDDCCIGIDLAAGKWVVPILVALAEGPLRTRELQRALGRELQDKVLAETLHRMTDAGLLSRTALRVLPPAVRYDLTDLGWGFLEPLTAMAGWVADNRELLPKRRGRAKVEPAGYSRRGRVSTTAEVDADGGEDAEATDDAGGNRNRSTAGSALPRPRLGPRCRQAILEQLGEADLEGVRDLP
jgi:DNA-binding HxlR family transcriptional regulator